MVYRASGPILNTEETKWWMTIGGVGWGEWGTSGETRSSYSYFHKIKVLKSEELQSFTMEFHERWLIQGYLSTFLRRNTTGHKSEFWNNSQKGIKNQNRCVSLERSMRKRVGRDLARSVSMSNISVFLQAYCNIPTGILLERSSEKKKELC